MAKPRPICVKCQSEMRCVANDFLVNDPAHGVFAATFWYGDKFGCDGCGAEVGVGFGGPVQAPQCDPSASMEFSIQQ